MNLLDFTRDQVVAISKIKITKKSILHYDVCMEIKKGTPMNKIAEKFGFSEPRHVFYIRDNKCPDCGII